MAVLTENKKLVRVGVYANVAAADRAVAELQKTGFTKDEISVISSNKVKEEFFSDVKNPPLPHDSAPIGAAAGAGVGATIAGLAAAAGIVATGGAGLFILGPILLAMGGGGVFGGLIGAMMSRGITREMADYYDQAVSLGKILVAVEDDAENTDKLRRAEMVFEATGAEPVTLNAR